MWRKNERVMVEEVWRNRRGDVIGVGLLELEIIVEVGIYIYIYIMVGWRQYERGGVGGRNSVGVG